MSILTETYGGALSDWIAQQQASQQKWGQAQQPLTEQVELFKPGGGYGAGQIALIEAELKKAGATGLSNMVASGMSSGSMASGLTARLGAEGTKAKLGVEDVRTQALAQALSQLSALRAGWAGQLGQTANPFANTMIGSLGGLEQTQISSATQLANTAAQIKSNEKIASMNNTSSGVSQQNFEIPTLHF